MASGIPSPSASTGVMVKLNVPELVAVPSVTLYVIAGTAPT